MCLICSKRCFLIFISISTILAMLMLGPFYEQQFNVLQIYAKSVFYDSGLKFESLNDSGPILNATEQVACKFPQLLIDDPLIKPYLKTIPTLECRKEKNWVSITGGRFYIHSQAADLHGNITCKLWKYERKDDDHFDEIALGVIANDTPIDADALYVQCKSKNGKTYENMHATVPLPNPTSELVGRIRKSRNPNVLNLSIFVYLMDSMSRINFLRKLPNFYSTLTRKLGAHVMEGFNVVGDGTPWAMIPMLTGHFQTELAEARKRLKNATYLDQWPFLFKNFANSGYVTSYGEEMPNFSAFSYKLKGFKNRPVDHYLRTFLQAERKYWKINKAYCLGDTPKSLLWTRYFRELQNVYRPLNARQFSVLFSAETSHDDYNEVQSLDEHLAREFEALYDENVLNDTLLIVMGDHGRRFGGVRQTQTGKIEEKLPFLALVAPPWFKRQYPEIDQNLLINRNRLVTVFDLHETFSNILDFKAHFGEANISKRGISLFKKIPANRTCADANIKAHFCSCLDWLDIDLKNRTALLAVQTVIDYFNQQASEINACAKLKLGKLISARILKPNEKLMAFKESLDFDNYTPNLSADKALYYVLYQIRFTTEPGGGDWEASLTYFLKTNTFGMSANDISRLNKYNDQAQCVINTHRHLRTFCYCKNDTVIT